MIPVEDALGLALEGGRSLSSRESAVAAEAMIELGDLGGVMALGLLDAGVRLSARGRLPWKEKRGGW